MSSTEIIKKVENKLNEIYASCLSFDELFNSNILCDSITANEENNNRTEIDFGDYVITLVETEKRDNYSLKTKSKNVRIGKWVEVFLPENNFSTTMRIVHVKDMLHLIK